MTAGELVMLPGDEADTSGGGDSTTGTATYQQVPGSWLRFGDGRRLGGSALNYARPLKYFGTSSKGLRP